MAKTVSKALVTGSAERVEEVSAALEAADVETVRVSDPDELAAAVSALDPGSLDCYVQLPVALTVDGDTIVARVRNFLEDGLLTRFRLAETVLPALSPEATVLLVTGHTLEGQNPPDDRAARIAFLEVLAHAVRADKAPAKVRVRVLRHKRAATEIARLALTGEPERGMAADVPDPAEREEMSYEDWRTEVLGLMRMEF